LNLRPETLVEHKADADSYCTAPKSKEKVIFPESVVGRAPMDFESYSGYVNVTSEDWLFYWFFENADGNPDAPLVIQLFPSILIGNDSTDYLDQWRTWLLFNGRCHN
jgi:hypothetical protein